MDYKYEHICKMKQPVLCEVCNKSYAIGVMKYNIIILYAFESSRLLA